MGEWHEGGDKQGLVASFFRTIVRRCVFAGKEHGGLADSVTEKKDKGYRHEGDEKPPAGITFLPGGLF